MFLKEAKRRRRIKILINNLGLVVMARSPFSRQTEDGGNYANEKEK